MPPLVGAAFLLYRRIWAPLTGPAGTARNARGSRVEDADLGDQSLGGLLSTRARMVAATVPMRPIPTSIRRIAMKRPWKVTG